MNLDNNVKDNSTEEPIYCVCGHTLVSHIDEGKGWRCHWLGPDFYQCECWLRKGKYDSINGYNLEKRKMEMLEDLKNSEFLKDSDV